MTLETGRKKRPSVPSKEKSAGGWLPALLSFLILARVGYPGGLGTTGLGADATALEDDASSTTTWRGVVKCP